MNGGGLGAALLGGSPKGPEGGTDLSSGPKSPRQSEIFSP